MKLSIANNVSSLTAQHNLSRSSKALGRSLERLSSGFKVNRGADGPAALVISEKQRAQIAGLRQAIDNSEKAVSLVQTGEGALAEINSLLVKVRSLAIDSANTGVNDDDALAANQAEIDNALDTINRIANNTQFGIKKLLDGSAGIQGVASDTNSVTFLRATSATAEASHAVNITTRGERAFVVAGTLQNAALAQSEILTINGVNVTLDAGLSQSQVRDRINQFTAQTGVIADTGGTNGETRLYTEVFGSAATIQAISNRAQAQNSSGIGNAATLTDNGVDVVATVAGITNIAGKGKVLTASSGPATGLSVSFATDAGNVTRTVGTGSVGTVTVTNNSMVFQIGPNKDQTAAVAIDKVNPASLGLGIIGNQFNNLDDINVTSANKAQDSLEVIDAAIDDITNLRGTLGAFQRNTLEATANNLRETLENTVNAESVIRDTDFATEIAEFTKQQVLAQAGTAVLSSTNQMTQLVLQLLQSA